MALVSSPDESRCTTTQPETGNASLPDKLADKPHHSQSHCWEQYNRATICNEFTRRLAPCRSRNGSTSLVSLRQTDAPPQASMRSDRELALRILAPKIGRFFYIGVQYGPDSVRFQIRSNSAVPVSSQKSVTTGLRYMGPEPGMRFGNSSIGTVLPAPSR